MAGKGRNRKVNTNFPVCVLPFERSFGVSLWLSLIYIHIYCVWYWSNFLATAPHRHHLLVLHHLAPLSAAAVFCPIRKDWLIDSGSSDDRSEGKFKSLSRRKWSTAIKGPRRRRGGRGQRGERRREKTVSKVLNNNNSILLLCSSLIYRRCTS